MGRGQIEICYECEMHPDFEDLVQKKRNEDVKYLINNFVLIIC